MTTKPAPYVGSGFVWRLEERLAHLLGRDRWPAIVAQTSSQHVPADLASYDAFLSLLPFSWTVEREPYATILRASMVRPRQQMTETHTTVLQYHPRHPGRVYYAPQMLLARLLLAIGAVAVLSAGVVLTLFLSVR